MLSTGRRKRMWGDRYDGYKIRHPDPLFQLIPVIMRTRTDSQVFFDEDFDLPNLDKYIRLKRVSDIPNLRMIHVIMASAVRVLSQRPQINRFVSGKKIYARNYIRFSLAIKRKMTDDAEEVTLIMDFSPTDTIYDVVNKFNATLNKTLGENAVTNDTMLTAKVLGVCPTFLKSFIVFICRKLDSIGKMPKFINRVSPFHSSIFITDVGSIGIRSIFHHLYEFGTTSVFMAIGRKEYVPYINDDGQISKKKILNLRLVGDERICDGYYFATAIKLFKRYLKQPSLLESPPESVVQDI